MSLARMMQMAAAGVSAAGDGVEFVGYNDTNLQGSYTLDYPTGTQSGDLLFLFCGNDDSVSAGTPSGWTKLVEGESPIDVFYRTASAETSVIAPAGPTPSIGGAIVVSFRNAAYVQSNAINLGTGHTPPTSFAAFSGATVGNSCVCFVWYDDDIQSGDATQTDFSVAVSDFYGSGAGSGCSMNVTYAFDVVNSATFTPPDLNASGIVSEGYRSWAFEIEPTVTPAAPSWTDPDLANASYDGVSSALGIAAPNALFMKPDGTKAYITDGNADAVKQFSLSTPWDASTLSYDGDTDGRFIVSSQAVTPTGVAFSSDGTKMFVMNYDTATSIIYQYSLSTAWAVSSASYDSVSYNPSADNNYLWSLAFNTDGSKLYTLNRVGTEVLRQYSLSTNWDISTASYDSKSLDVYVYATDPRSFFFNPDGTKLWVLDEDSDTIYEWVLSTGFDISTASYNNLSFYIGGQDTIANGLFFKSDGSKMYVVGSGTDTIYQYSTD